MEKIRVLYIEDDKKQREPFAKQLRSQGFELHAVDSGEKGLAAFKGNKPDVILCDLNMPKMSGLDVLKQVKSMDREMPFVILTAHGSVDQAVSAIKHGAYDFVLKPLKIHRIETTIHKALEKKHLQKELEQAESSLQMLMDNVPDIVYSLNPEGEFLSVNPASEVTLGYSPNEMLGSSVFDYIYSEDRQRVQSGFKHAMENGDRLVKTVEFRMVAKTGEIKYFEVNRRLVFKDGTAVRQDGIARDVTERKLLEQQLEDYSHELEQRVRERTKSLEYATRQLAALNIVSNRFTQIFDEEELINEAPPLLCNSLDFDRALLLLEEKGKFDLRSYCMGKDSPELVEQFLNRVRSDDFDMPPHFIESFEQNKTIFIPDLNADPRWPREPGQTVIRTKAVVVSPIRANKKPIGLIIGNMQHHDREMDHQDVARFEMFANMVGLALDNIRAYQNLERKIIERTRSLRDANRELRRKAKELEENTYSLANANVELLSVQEQLEKSNAEMKKLLQELSESETKNRALLDAIPDLMFQISENGQILDYKDSGSMGLYAPPKEFLGKKITEVFSSDLASQTLQFVRQTLKTRQVQIFEYQLPFNGSMHDYEARMVVSGDDRVLVIVRDITERKQAEEALRRERNFVSAILDTSGALVVVLDTKGRIVRFNRACEQTTGYAFEEVEGKHFWDLFLIPSEVGDVRAVFDNLVAGDFPNYYENYWQTKDGGQRLITWSNTALLDEEKNVEYIIGTGIDVTDRKEAEEKLRLYKEIFINSKDPINILDANGRFIEQNPAHRKLNGYSDEELLGKTPALFTGEETFRRIGKSLSETGSFRGEIISHPKSGGKVHVELSAFSIHDDHGEATYRIGFARDITERKQAEEKIATRLRYEEGLAACSRALLEGRDDDEALNDALLHLLVAANVGRVYIFENFEDDKDGLCLRQTYEVCAPGVTPEMDNPLLQHVPYREGFRRWQEILSSGRPLHGIVDEFPQREREVLEPQDIQSILILPINVGTEWYGIVGFDDVNQKRQWGEEDIRLLQTAAELIGGYIEHRQAEEALMESEERFRNLVENANDIIYSLTPDGRFVYVSPNWKDILGHDASEVQGNSFEPFIHPDDLEVCRTFLKNVITSGEKQSGAEYRVRHKDQTWKWHSASASPFKDSDGNILYVIGISHDITEKRKFLDELAQANRDLRNTQAQLVQSEKMASLGMLVAGIAHEINTPIGAVHSMHDTLKRAVEKLRKTLESQYEKDFRDNRDLSAPIKMIEDANRVIDTGSERVINIVRRLRSFARLDEAELKEADIHEGLEDTLTLIHHEIKHNITVNRNYGELPRIACFPGRLNQVFLNLLINAKQAIKDKGEITLTTSQKDGKIHIAIQDTGVGIPQDKLKQIFDPGFTTKGVGIGTGLGLSIVYQILQEHRGQITVESEVG
ncbi:PAS domain S-box protein, partial [candidate division KSB1 bacterium]|nr:PAS domain S-box protein [candidate division KSB1 bacterium]NIR70557.1 PAS domain S-box protein [candidate division KSB1 bacterium]NIS27703.1 PAS domain S-box protein [candidate division KSB1 bacterium]NIT70477.1 PAS domain S-box protein [candidate division KSB1 bacterium]NIU28356.1 PAS domain S-box protein [candidate division KSB1 bacterium]